MLEKIRKLGRPSKSGLKPITRNYLRHGMFRNKACFCGATKPGIEEVDGKIIEIQVPKKAKECCMRKDWPKSEANWPNNFGNYNPEVVSEKRKRREAAV